MQQSDRHIVKVHIKDRCYLPFYDQVQAVVAPDFVYKFGDLLHKFLQKFGKVLLCHLANQSENLLDNEL